MKRHRQQRGNPDAASDQDGVVDILLQLEVASWRTNGEGISLPHLLMHRARSAARLRLVLDRDPIAIQIAGFAAERILPDEPLAYVHLDTRARRKRRQLASRGIGQLQ